MPEYRAGIYRLESKRVAEMCLGDLLVGQITGLRCIVPTLKSFILSLGGLLLTLLLSHFTKIYTSRVDSW